MTVKGECLLTYNLVPNNKLTKHNLRWLFGRFAVPSNTDQTCCYNFFQSTSKLFFFILN